MSSKSDKMPKYEHVILKGIPFLMDDSKNILTYEIRGNEPIVIGSLAKRSVPPCAGAGSGEPDSESTSDTSATFTLLPDWQTRTIERIEKWRTEMLPAERGTIREHYKAPKQSRSRKNTRKPATTA